ASAHGFVCLAANDAKGAAGWFERALTLLPDHARSWIGLGEARRLLGDERGADDARARATQAIKELSSHGRLAESAMARAAGFFIDHDIKDGCHALTSLLSDAPPGLAGWTLPVEPWLTPYLDDKRVVTLLEQLAGRAR
ncbi:MAG: hypothetical protein KA205_05165, partial [Acidobacteria bacterium]|nr:hypothetical protein [Acidobacteriota bacterium]